MNSTNANWKDIARLRETIQTAEAIIIGAGAGLSTSAGFSYSGRRFKENFPDLYQFRWGVESKYRELKNRLEIEAFNSIKPASIQQEFFAAMYLSNLVAVIKSESDSKIIVSINNRHAYQANRSYILNRIKNCIVHLLRSPLSICYEMICRIVEEASKTCPIIRPDRKFGRYRKHTRRRYYSHMKSCI